MDMLIHLEKYIFHPTLMLYSRSVCILKSASTIYITGILLHACKSNKSFQHNG